MAETLAGGSGSQSGIDTLSAVDGDPDPFWSEEEQRAFTEEIEEIQRKIRSAPVAGQILRRELIINFDKSDHAQRLELGPYQRLGSVALSLN